MRCLLCVLGGWLLFLFWIVLLSATSVDVDDGSASTATNDVYEQQGEASQGSICRANVKDGGGQGSSSCHIPKEDDVDTAGSTKRDDEYGCRDEAPAADCPFNHFVCHHHSSYELLSQCRKSCGVCHPSILPQADGQGRVPPEISLQVIHVMQDTTQYFVQRIQPLLQPQHYPSSFLQLLDCRDQRDICAYWKLRGQCISDQHREFMERECPLTCRICERQRTDSFLSFLFNDVQPAYFKNYKRNDNNSLVYSRRVALETVMAKVGMDPQVVRQLPRDNWLLDLHQRLHAWTPAPLLQLYNNDDQMDPNSLALIASLYNLATNNDADEEDTGSMEYLVTSQILIPYRTRGYALLSLWQDLLDPLVTRPIQLQAGFSVPNNHSLQRIAANYPKIVYMGAGSGYWAVFLQRRNVDVVAYDIDPPPPVGSTIDGSANAFFDTSYFPNMRQGSCTKVILRHSERALMFVWPNDPDPVDNRHYCEQDDGCNDSQPVWDAECLRAYLDAGGQDVVYVGERESMVSRTISATTTSDGGTSATREFQQLLQQEYYLVETIAIPNWWLNQDDVTFWRRKGEANGTS